MGDNNKIAAENRMAMVVIIIFVLMMIGIPMIDYILGDPDAVRTPDGNTGHSSPAPSLERGGKQ